jgi:hypothetical protein
MNAPVGAMILDLRARSCNLSTADTLTFRPLDLELTEIGLSLYVYRTFIPYQ